MRGERVSEVKCGRQVEGMLENAVEKNRFGGENMALAMLRTLAHAVKRCRESGQGGI